MPNAKTATGQTYRRILLVGPNGSGKSSQIWTLPGTRFAYLFDPNTMATIAGCDVEYEEFYPDVLELDATLKGFNKGSIDDKLPSKREPKVYNNWLTDFNKRAEAWEKGDNPPDWLVIDSLTFQVQQCMNRQLYINQRYGHVEDQADYRVVGGKIAAVYTSISSLRMNVLVTAHFQTYEDEHTKRIETKLKAPGSARDILPLVFTEVWQAGVEERNGKLVYTIRTVPDPRGFKGIRTSLKGLEAVEDVTIPLTDNRFPADAHRYGIGRLLTKALK